MSLRRIAGIAVALLMSQGCAQQDQVTALEKRTADIEKRASVLESELKSTKELVTALEQQKSWDQTLRDLDAVAYLTPGSDGYSTITSDLGRVTVMLANVQPYANGTRVTLRFGNLLSATINGAKATIEWGSVDEKGSPKNDTARSREFTFNESLRAGAWTNVQVVLEGVPPNALGFVRVREMSHTGISLNR